MPAIHHVGPWTRTADEIGRFYSTRGISSTSSDTGIAASITLDSDLLDLQPVNNRFEPPVRRHPDWDVVRTRTRVYELQYPWRPAVHYPVVAFRLSLRRRRRQRQPPLHQQRRVPASGTDDARVDTDLMPALRRLPGSASKHAVSSAVLLGSISSAFLVVDTRR